jgi:DNA-binding NtrC family response regulator
MEQEYIKHVLKFAAGKKMEAAKILGIDKTTLWRKLRKLENTSDEDAN